MAAAIAISGREEWHEKQMDWDEFVEKAGGFPRSASPGVNLRIREIKGDHVHPSKLPVGAMEVNREVVLRFASLKASRMNAIFPTSPFSINEGESTRESYGLRSSSDKEARFFLTILESSVRNSLERKRRLGGLSDEKARGLISEVSDIVGIISISNKRHFTRSTNRDKPGYWGLNNLLEVIRVHILSTPFANNFPNLSQMAKKDFDQIFIEDLTSLYTYSKVLEVGLHEWVDWEHKRTRDVAALRLWFSPEERISLTRRMLSEIPELFGKYGLERFAISRLSVDWIEIGFSISETEGYLEFLKSINTQSRLGFSKMIIPANFYGTW